jgi:hypothetical protein
VSAGARQMARCRASSADMNASTSSGGTAWRRTGPRFGARRGVHPGRIRRRAAG